MIFDIDTWHPGLAFAFMLSPFIIMFSGLLMIIFMAYRNLETILEYFPSSEYVRRQKALWGGNNLSSRFILTSSLAAIALLPNWHIKRGELDENEVRSLPHSLKRRMIVSWGLCSIGMAWLILSTAILKITGE